MGRNGRRRRGRPAAARPGEEGLEVGDDPDGWGPPASERKGEGAEVGRRDGIGPGWAAVGRKEGRGVLGRGRIWG
jgi:hypothetical protein